MSSSSSSAQAFWDHNLRQKHLPAIDPAQYRAMGPPTNRAFLQLIGDVQGKRILEIGCGNGYLSIYLAKMGAHLTATDFSAVAIEQVDALAKINNVADRLDARHVNALDLRSLDTHFDLIVGRFILHHVEPFASFVEVMHDVLVPGGRGVFFENNARNPLLMFARTYLSGHMGIPKYGDEEEHPLEPEEIDLLHRRFARVQQHYPEFIFFQKLNTYLFRHDPRYEAFLQFFRRLDQIIFEHFPMLHKYSYNQLVELERSA